MTGQKSMEIRRTKPGELSAVMVIYAEARRFMRSQGNMTQWTNGYPGDDIILNDIQNGNSYVCVEDGRIAGVFSFILGDDPSYAQIFEGAWLSDAPYGTVHRIAVSVHNKGVATFCLDWCYNKSGNVRIDTHRDNLAMQKLVTKNGFVYCGIINLPDGSPRLAYQKNQSLNWLVNNPIEEQE